MQKNMSLSINSMMQPRIQHQEHTDIELLHIIYTIKHTKQMIITTMKHLIQVPTQTQSQERIITLKSTQLSDHLLIMMIQQYQTILNQEFLYNPQQDLVMIKMQVCMEKMQDEMEYSQVQEQVKQHKSDQVLDYAYLSKGNHILKQVTKSHLI